MPKKIEFNRIVSNDTRAMLADNKTKGQILYSFFPCDRWNCECVVLKNDKIAKLALLNEEKRREAILREDHMECPRDKDGMKCYRITCNNCDSIIAELWSKDEALSDFCDLHYISYTDGEVWKGAFGINISPIDGKLGFECACGSDTRDFRANTTMPGKAVKDKIDENMQGRDFGVQGAKFNLTQINKVTDKELQNLAKALEASWRTT